ncbi:MAG TPA: hypothetical protein VGB02_18210 [Pyrinomonadaceae bacterium]
MSAKTEKKIRQLYKRELREKMQKVAKERMDALIPQLRKSVKKPPRWFPKMLWYKLAVVFINLD